MNRDINDVVAELDRIDELVTRYCDLGDELDELERKKDSDLREVIFNYYPELPDDMPVFSAIQPEVKPINPKSVKRVKVGLVGFAAAFMVWLLTKMVTSVGLNKVHGLIDWDGIAGKAILAMIAFAIVFVITYRNYAEEKREHDAMALRRRKFEKIINTTHAQDVVNFQTQMDEYSAKHQLYYHKFEDCYDEYVDNHNQIVEKIDQIETAMAEVTLISSEHIVLARRISNLLKSGRADSLKEAINLAISEKRDEEYIAQRLAEEERRTQILEQQAYDNLLHNQRMEREAEAQTQHAQTQLRIAEEQLKATVKQNEQLKQLLDSKKVK